MSARYTDQVRHVHGRIGKSVPIERFVDEYLDPVSIGLQDKSQFYEPIRFGVHVTGRISSPKGTIRVAVPVHANPAWASQMKTRFARMINMPHLTDAQMEFRTVDGRQVDEFDVDELPHVGRLSVYVDGDRLLLPALPAVPVEYSTNKPRLVQKWIDKVAAELPETLADTLAHRNAVELDRALQRGGDVERAVYDELGEPVAHGDWAHFVRVHNINSPDELADDAAEEARWAIARTISNQVRAYFIAAKTAVDAHLAETESKRLAAQAKEQGEEYAPIFATVSSSAAPTAVTAGDGGANLFCRLGQDVVTSPYFSKALMDGIYTHPLPVEGCRWDVEPPRPGAMPATTTPAARGGGARADGGFGGGGGRRVPSTRRASPSKGKSELDDGPTSTPSYRDNNSMTRIENDDFLYAYGELEGRAGIDAIDAAREASSGPRRVFQQKWQTAKGGSAADRLRIGREAWEAFKTSQTRTLRNPSTEQMLAIAYVSTRYFGADVALDWQQYSNLRTGGSDIVAQIYAKADAAMVALLSDPEEIRRAEEDARRAAAQTTERARRARRRAEQSKARAEEAVLSGRSQAEVTQAFAEVVQDEEVAREATQEEAAVADVPKAPPPPQTIPTPPRHQTGLKERWDDTNQRRPTKEELIAWWSNVGAKGKKGKKEMQDAFFNSLRKEQLEEVLDMLGLEPEKGDTNETYIQAILEVMRGDAAFKDATSNMPEVQDRPPERDVDPELESRLRARRARIDGTEASINTPHHPWNALVHHTIEPATGSYPTYYKQLHTKQDMTADAEFAADPEETYRAFHAFSGAPITVGGGALIGGCSGKKHHKHHKQDKKKHGYSRYRYDYDGAPVDETELVGDYGERPPLELVERKGRGRSRSRSRKGRSRRRSRYRSRSRSRSRSAASRMNERLVATGAAFDALPDVDDIFASDAQLEAVAAAAATHDELPDVLDVFL